MEVVKEEFVSTPEAKEIMAERAKEKNLAYEQKICLEYLDKISVLTKSKFNKIKQELSEIKILKPKHIVMIINTLPDTMDEVNMLFGKEINLKKEEIEKIIETVNLHKT